MLEQEQYKDNIDDDLNDDKDPELHPLYREVTVEDGTILFYSPVSGYLLKEKPLVSKMPLGGILADEMGLGKTVEVLSLMLSNPRKNIPQPEYLEPIKYSTKKKKKSRRRRSPSPVEFYIREDDSTNIAQVDGGDTTSDEDDESEDDKDSSDEDFEPEVSTNSRVKPRQSRRNNASSSGRVFSDNRTVYYHEDFDSLSSDDEVIPKPSRKPKPKAANKRLADQGGSQKPVKKRKVRAESNDSSASSNDLANGKANGPKIKNTLQKHDESYPIYDPFKEGKFIEKNASLYDQIVRTIQILVDGKKATDGVTVRNIKTYLEKHFKRNVQNKQFSKKLSDNIEQGISKGQFIKTNISTVSRNTKIIPKNSYLILWFQGVNLAITLNLHFNPNDSRGRIAKKRLRIHLISFSSPCCSKGTGSGR